jgi:hypothetical protein
MRTANVGDGKDSEARQRKAIEGYAKATGMVIVDWFYDAAVSGADPIEARPGFAALLARIARNGARTIIVETANRFARDLMVQEVGFAMLRDLGVTLIAADSRLIIPFLVNVTEGIQQRWRRAAVVFRRHEYIRVSIINNRRPLLRVVVFVLLHGRVLWFIKNWQIDLCQIRNIRIEPPIRQRTLKKPFSDQESHSTGARAAHDDL